MFLHLHGEGDGDTMRSRICQQYNRLIARARRQTIYQRRHHFASPAFAPLLRRHRPGQFIFPISSVGTNCAQYQGLLLPSQRCRLGNIKLPVRILQTGLKPIQMSLPFYRLLLQTLRSGQRIIPPLEQALCIFQRGWTQSNRLCHKSSNPYINFSSKIIRRTASLSIGTWSSDEYDRTWAGGKPASSDTAFLPAKAK